MKTNTYYSLHCMECDHRLSVDLQFDMNCYQRRTTTLILPPADCAAGCCGEEELVERGQVLLQPADPKPHRMGALRFELPRHVTLIMNPHDLLQVRFGLKTIQFAPAGTVAILLGMEHRTGITTFSHPGLHHTVTPRIGSTSQLKIMTLRIGSTRLEEPAKRTHEREQSDARRQPLKLLKWLSFVELEWKMPFRTVTLQATLAILFATFWEFIPAPVRHFL